MNELLSQLIEILRSIPADIKRIVERKIQLLILETGGSLSDAVASLLPKIIGLLALLLGLVFLLVAAAIGLGHFLGDVMYGFLIIGVVFFIPGIIYFIKTANLEKSKIKKKLEKQFVLLSDKIESKSLANEEPKALKK